MHNKIIKEKLFLMGCDNYEFMFRPIIYKHCSYRRLTLFEIESVNNKFNSEYQANALLRVLQVPFHEINDLIRNTVYPFFKSDPLCVMLSDSVFDRAIELESIEMMDFSFPFDFDSKSAIAIYSNASYRMAIVDWYEDEDCTQIAELSMFSYDVYKKRMQSFRPIVFGHGCFDLSNFPESNIFVIKEDSIRQIMHVICGIANETDVYSSSLLILANKTGLRESLDDEMRQFNSYITYRYEIIEGDKKEYLVVQIIPVMYGLTLYRGQAWAIDNAKNIIPAGSEESKYIYTSKLKAFNIFP